MEVAELLGVDAEVVVDEVLEGPRVRAVAEATAAKFRPRLRSRDVNSN